MTTPHTPETPMTDQTDAPTVRIPWHDGTERLVPVGTRLLCGNDTSVVFADEDGWHFKSKHVGDGDPNQWNGITVTAVLTEGPEPPVAGIDPMSVEEWTWCLVRDHAGNTVVWQVRRGKCRSGIDGNGTPFLDCWTILARDVLRDGLPS